MPRLTTHNVMRSTPHYVSESECDVRTHEARDLGQPRHAGVGERREQVVRVRLAHLHHTTTLPYRSNTVITTITRLHAWGVFRVCCVLRAREESLSSRGYDA